MKVSLLPDAGPGEAFAQASRFREDLFRLPDRARGRTVRARGRVTVRGRSGDLASGPRAGGRAPMRARRDVPGVAPRERGRAPASAGAGRAADGAGRRRAPGPGCRRQQLAPPRCADQRGPPVLPRLRPRRTVLGPVHPWPAVLVRRRPSYRAGPPGVSTWTPSASDPRTMSPRSPPPSSAGRSPTSSRWAAGTSATAASSSSSTRDGLGPHPPRLTTRSALLDHTSALRVIEGTLIRLQVDRLPSHDRL